MLPMGQVSNLVDASFKRPADLPCTCSDAHLLEAVRGWMLNAPSEQVARLLNVETRTLKEWTNAPGWYEIVTLIRDDIRALSYGAYGRLGLKAFTALEERLDKGDPIIGFGEDGTPETLGYKPLTAKVVADVMRTLALLQDQTEKKMGKGEKDDDKISLSDLASGLMRYAKAKEIDGEVTNVYSND